MTPNPLMEDTIQEQGAGEFRQQIVRAGPAPLSWPESCSQNRPATRHTGEVRPALVNESELPEPRDIGKSLPDAIRPGCGGFFIGMADFSPPFPFVVIHQFDTRRRADLPQNLGRSTIRQFALTVTDQYPLNSPLSRIAGGSRRDGQSLYVRRLVEDKQNVLDRIDEVRANQAAIFALEQPLEAAMALQSSSITRTIPFELGLKRAGIRPSMSVGDWTTRCVRAFLGDVN